MATELDRTTALQALADSTAFIIDRTVFPEKIVGQAWLISKGRIVTMASAVSNYADAPWALQIKFPHPGISYSVRTVTLHPDFNKREARDYYLAQAQSQLPPPVMENDIATLALDSDLTPPPPERVAELNRALAVPFEISPQDMSGSMRTGDIPAILQSVLSTGRSGLLTMIDARNIPFARIAVRQTRIARASYQNLFNEIAICELIYRQPSGSFAFQLVEYRWPHDVPEVMTPTEQIMAEAMRRSDEIPRVMEMLGGSEVRFQRAMPLADFSTIPPQERWLAERLWEALDGYLPLGKVAERVCSDTYSALKMIWDLATMGLLGVNQSMVFHGNGQLGPLMVPAQELDLNTWDVLQGFYLDPISGSPIIMQGNFFGGAHVLTNKTLLHTIPVPSTVQGAIILKEGKFVGLHTGPYSLRGALNPPPVALQRMMWVGSLNDLSTKRLRTAEVAAAEAAANAEAAAQMPVDPAISQPLRVKSIRGVAEPGTAEAVAPPVEVETGPLARFSKTQVVGASGVVFALGLIMMVMSMFAGHSQQPSPPPTVSTTTDTTTNVATVSTATQTSTADTDIGDPAAAAIGKDMMGMTRPPDSFKFKDTTKLTDPKRSFAVISEAKNLDVTFIEWPNPVPLQDLEWVARHTPVYNLYRRDELKNEFTGNTSHINWAASHYRAPDEDNAVFTAVVGSFPEEGNGSHCIVFVARPVAKGTNIPDISFPSNLIEECLAQRHAAPATAAGNQGSKPTPDDGGASAGTATPEQLADYRRKLQALFKAEYHPPHYELETNTKVGMKLKIDASGNLSDLELEPNPSDEFNQAFQRAITLAAPLPPPPKTKNGTYSIHVRAHANDITVEER
jgi:hypothetical protein